MMKPFCLHAVFAALFVFLTAGARAGDMASVEILGFSADGGIFAFEEYGVQDGSGFAYANRYYIDTASDRFLPGTPVRVRLEKEGATPADARAAAREQAQSVIDDAVLAANRGFTAGWNAVTELSVDPLRMTVNPRPVVPAIDAPIEYRLTELPMPEAAECHGLGEAAGFRLTRVALTPEAQTRIVHEDKDIPQSRTCPLGYRIAGIQTFHPQDAAPVVAVIIAVRRLGFEGPDHRYIAVTDAL